MINHSAYTEITRYSLDNDDKASVVSVFMIMISEQKQSLLFTKT